ncbi:PA14 domain-containing protein [uncultured Formosa sp.]|uniref:PA14 domain-containing protein n=1 Tax=uncultured Formosa sp. TaxID=255435 RepID=UPI0026040060|nr:PA14 domain-containing protein [uncultured Formosa sp.]
MRPYNFYKYCFALCICIAFYQNTKAQNDDMFFKHTIQEEKKPWTDKPFYNDPNNFQFAIVSDRTGGHREGVFGKGLEKINQLYPEFVMSVGDLIEGYTKDPTLLKWQWKEFHGILDTLQTKFFYVAGNHDYSNPTMGEDWKARYGKDYYHFKYKDVLFLVLNTNDGDGVLMGRDQIEFLKETIAQNTDVRWTMVFMHHPMWTFGDVNGFDEVEEALKGRDYTVFAGHTHRYLHEVKNDQNHYVLGTTGGGSALRGPRFGEFDHVGWVTMTDSGPKLVNLELSGIIDQDVSNVNSIALARELIESTDFKPLVLYKNDERKVVLSLNNSSEKTIYFKGQLYHHHQIETDVSKFELELEPKSFHQIVINTTPLVGNREVNWDPLELEWEMGYEPEFMTSEFSLKGIEVVALDTNETNINFTEKDIFIDEQIVELNHPYTNNLTVKYTLDGTKPNLESQTLKDDVMLKNTTIVNAVLSDSEGFISHVSTKEYRKVKPESAIKVRHPKQGLAYSYYEDDFTRVPDFKVLTPKSSGVTLELDPDKIGERLDHYAIQYSGYIKITETGVYTFHLMSDDGAKLYINELEVVDNDGSHDTSVKKGRIALKKGWHPIRIDYFEDYLGERLELEYSSENRKKSKVELWH